MLLPLFLPPGHAWLDFGEMAAVTAGAERKVQYFMVDMPQWWWLLREGLSVGD